MSVLIVLAFFIYPSSLASTKKEKNKKTLVLYRYQDSETPSILKGAIYHRDRYLCQTLELPYRDNQSFISSIPPGTYPLSLKKHKGAKLNHRIQLLNVPHRSNILIHTGNSYLDTDGCILTGLSYQNTKIRHSLKAYRRLLDYLLEKPQIKQIQIIQKGKNDTIHVAPDYRSSLSHMSWS